MIYLSKGLDFFCSSTLDSYGLAHGFGTRQLGDGRDTHILANHLSIHKKPYNHIIKPRQTHSTNVSVIQKQHLTEETIPINDCDGVVTREKRVAVSVITADCMPIIYFEPKAGVVGISHQGWKGTTNNLPCEMIEAMKTLNADPAQIQCAMGPAINRCCYHLDLYTINYETLLRSGVHKQNIELFPFCTACDDQRFYSYRREGRINGEMIHFAIIV